MNYFFLFSFLNFILVRIEFVMVNMIIKFVKFKLHNYLLLWVMTMTTTTTEDDASDDDDDNNDDNGR